MNGWMEIAREKRADFVEELLSLPQAALIDSGRLSM